MPHTFIFVGILFVCSYLLHACGSFVYLHIHITEQQKKNTHMNKHSIYLQYIPRATSIYCHKKKKRLAKRNVCNSKFHWCFQPYAVCRMQQSLLVPHHSLAVEAYLKTRKKNVISFTAFTISLLFIYV